MIKYRAREQIQEGSNAIKDLMQEHLANAARGIIDQIAKNVRNSSDSNRYNATKGITWTGIGDYRAALLDAMTVISASAIDQARKEVPKAKSVTLGEWEDLPASIRKKLTAKSQLLIDTQYQDLEKSIFFQFQSSIDSTDSWDTIEQDLVEASDNYVYGASVISGSGAISAQIVNEARSAFFYDDEVLDEIEAFVFVNGDPVSDICKDLAGTIFAKDDPGRDRYQPPLHWNCKSSIQPILNGNLDWAMKKYKSDGIEKLVPSKSSLEDQIQFSSCCKKHRKLDDEIFVYKVTVTKNKENKDSDLLKLANEHSSSKMVLSKDSKKESIFLSEHKEESLDKNYIRKLTYGYGVEVEYRKTISPT